MIGLAFLDTDFICKTSNIKKDTSTLFDEILKLPYEFRVTKKVFSELLTKEVKQDILRLSSEGKIVIVDNTEIILQLYATFSEVDCIKIVLKTLKTICNTLWEDDAFYKKNFKSLEVYEHLESDLSLFCGKLEEKIKNIPPKNNIGEITTLLNIVIANIIGDYEIISLLSHDKSARRCVLEMPENVKSYSCYSCFYLLKNQMTYEESKSYVKIWKRNNPEQLIEIIIKGNKQGIPFDIYLKYIYEEKTCNVIRNGILTIT